MSGSTFKAFWRIIVPTTKSWIRHEPLRQSAVIAYFAIFSIPALLVLALNFAALFMKRETINKEVSRQIKTTISQGAAEQLQKAVEHTGNLEEGVISTIIGIVIILFGATRVFIQLKKTLNEIWEVKAKKKSFLRAFLNSVFSVGLILSLGFLLLTSMVVTTLLTAASHWLQQVFVKEVVYLFYVIELLLSVGLISFLFALLFRFLPDVKITWRQVFPGALLTGVLFIILKYAISFYFSRAEPASAYGNAGSVVLVLLWVAVCSMIVFFGAEFTKQYTIYHRIKIEPGKNAEKTEQLTAKSNKVK